MASADFNTTVASGDLSDEVAAAKDRAEGDIAFFGGPTVAQALIARDLVDEFRLFVHPVVLGSGQALFPEAPARLPLELVESRPFDGTSTYIHWRRLRD